MNILLTSTTKKNTIHSFVNLLFHSNHQYLPKPQTTQDTNRNSIYIIEYLELLGPENEPKGIEKLMSMCMCMCMMIVIILTVFS